MGKVIITQVRYTVPYRVTLLRIHSNYPQFCPPTPTDKYCGVGTPGYSLVSTGRFLELEFVSGDWDFDNTRIGFWLYYTAFHNGTSIFGWSKDILVILMEYIYICRLFILIYIASAACSIKLYAITKLAFNFYVTLCVLYISDWLIGLSSVNNKGQYVGCSWSIPITI